MNNYSNTDALYKVYGYILRTNFEFRHTLHRASGTKKADLTFEIVIQSPFGDCWKKITPNFISPLKTDKGKNTGYIYQLDNYHVISLPDLADFFITENYIYCQPQADNCFDLIESRLLTSVLTHWLELKKDNQILHASSVNVDGEGIAFLANSKGGKSSLAAAFVKKGYPLITDDILRVTKKQESYFASVGYPCMHLWPETLKYLNVSESVELSKITNKTKKLLVPCEAFSDVYHAEQDIKITRLYLPIRNSKQEDNSIRIENVSSSDSLFHIISNCYSSVAFGAFGWQEQKLKSIAKMVESVPVKRIIYPDGFAYLNDVVNAILAD